MSLSLSPGSFFGQRKTKAVFAQLFEAYRPVGVQSHVGSHDRAAISPLDDLWQATSHFRVVVSSVAVVNPHIYPFPQHGNGYTVNIEEKIPSTGWWGPHW